MGKKFTFDFDYVYSPEWTPPGSNIKPWFLPEGMGKGKDMYDTSLKAILWYRTEKLDFVRKQLEGVDRDKVLKDIINHIWKDTTNDIERFKNLVFFVQRMMIHPPAEQPMEKDAHLVFRGLKGDSLATQSEPYPEDLEKPWAVKAYNEAVAFGKYLGVWCNPLQVTMDGDWGLAGMVTDALELLLLHEGRCGHQACVVVQLAQAAGWRGRLVQLNCHRVAEVFVDGKWRLADPDELEQGFIGTDDKGEPASIEWCINNLDKIRNWPVKKEFYRFFADKDDKYAWHYKAKK
ncbi:MAG: hypothetical protein HPY74_00240 [Firmicutes bacterium]|nr:hypothetical protein [Bacillota bacterium]